MSTKSNYYVNFDKCQQARFMRECKLHLSLSWEKIAKLLQVNRSMIFQYLNETSMLPKRSFLKLSKIGNVSPTKYSYSFKSANLYGNGIIPTKLDSNLAEFIGIFLGDGNLYNANHQITISCGRIDGNYIKKFIPQLIKKLFKKEGSFRRMKKNSIDFRFSSKIVCDFLKREYKLKSPKIECKIPHQLFSDNKCLKSCIRGLIDTDGGIHAHHNNSVQIKFTNKSLPLINTLIQTLNSLDLKVSKTYDKRNGTYSIYMFGNEVIKYYKEIGFHNPKNNLKYTHWIKKKRVPSNKEL